jgi:hypothetical protein
MLAVALLETTVPAILFQVIIIIIIWLYCPIRALASSLMGFRNINLFYRAGLLVQRPTPNLEDQASVFMTLGDRVAQLYPQALGTHFSRLLRHEWIAVGLFFNPGHHTGFISSQSTQITTNIYVFTF